MCNITHIYICFCLGWTNELKDGKLNVYQVKVFECGPEVVLSMTIEERFSWQLLFQRQLVDPVCCGILRDTPSGLNSGSYIA